MSEYIQCPNCEGEITEDSDFCPHCGILFEGSNDIFCDTHQQVAATGVCIICRKVLCGQCSANHDGRIFCQDHNEVDVREDWAKVFESTEVNDAELVKSILQTAEYKVQVQNFGSIGYAWDGGGDSPQSRSNLNRAAKVFVPIPEYLEAMKTIGDWQSSPTDTAQG